MQTFKIVNCVASGSLLLFAAIELMKNGQIAISGTNIYEIYPWSLAIFSAFILYLTFRTQYVTYAIPIAAMAGITFDFVGSSLALYKPDFLAYFMWVFVPVVIYFTVRPKMHFNPYNGWLWGYFILFAIGWHHQNELPTAWLWEVSTESAWCVVFLKTFIKS